VRNAIQTIVIAGILSLPSGGFAQSKIGYVDWNAVLERAPQIPLGRQNLDEQFRQRNAELSTQKARLEQLEQRLLQEGPLMSAEQQGNLEREIRTLRRDVSRIENDLRDEFDFQLEQERQQIEKQILAVISAYATENGFDLITPGPVLYASDAIDLTQSIIERLRVEYVRSESNR